MDGNLLHSPLLKLAFINWHWGKNGVSIGHLYWHGDYGLLKFLLIAKLQYIMCTKILGLPEWILEVLFSPKRWGYFFQILDYHNFHINGQNLLQKVYLDSMHQDISICMLHDIIVSYQIWFLFLFEFKVQKYSCWIVYRIQKYRCWIVYILVS